MALLYYLTQFVDRAVDLVSCQVLRRQEGVVGGAHNLNVSGTLSVLHILDPSCTDIDVPELTRSLPFGNCQCGGRVGVEIASQTTAPVFVHRLDAHALGGAFY